MPQDTIDHQKNYSKISKIKREEKDLTPLSIEENLRRNQKTHIPFLFKKKSLKKENSHPNFLKKNSTLNFFSLFFQLNAARRQHILPYKNIKLFRIFYNLLASLGIANFKLDCDSYLFLFSLSLTLLSLLLKQLLLSLNL